MKKELSQSDAVNSLISFYSEAGKSINDLPALLGRQVSTLKRRARKIGVSFPDYKPRS